MLEYEDVFASGRCRLPLADLIAQADRNPDLIPTLIRLIDGICEDLCAAATRTGEIRSLADCVPALYADRIHPGGRIDTWYLTSDPVIYQRHRRQLTLRDLAGLHADHRRPRLPPGHPAGHQRHPPTPVTEQPMAHRHHPG